MNRLHAVLFLILLALPGVVMRPGIATAATPILGGDAGPADLRDPFAGTINPALATLVSDRIAVGDRIMHLGLLDDATALNTGRAVAAGRRFGGGTSLSLAWLSTPVWGEREMSLGYGRRIAAGCALGLRVGLNQRSFSRDSFVLEDEDDPLLSGSLSRTVATVSLGAVYSAPWRGLTAGLVLDNPHEPSVSLDGRDNEARLPRTLRAGLGLEYGRWQGSLSAVATDERTRMQGRLRVFVAGDHALTAGLENDFWSLGARYGVSEHLWVGYDFSLPHSSLAGATSGSHQLLVCFQLFGYRGPRPTLKHRPLLRDEYAFKYPRIVRVSEPRAAPIRIPRKSIQRDLLFVEAGLDTAMILHKRITRSFGRDMDMDRIGKLPRWRIGVMDSTWSHSVVHSLIEDDEIAAPSSSLPGGNYSEGYRRNVTSLGTTLAAGGRVRIVAEDGQLGRVGYLARRLRGAGAPEDAIVVSRFDAPSDSTLRRMLFTPVGRGEIPLVEEFTVLPCLRIPFPVHRLGGGDSIREWRLDIANSQGEEVRTLSGRAAPPDTLYWDWMDEDGSLVGVDNYIYCFSWRNENGAEFRLAERELLVVRQTLHKSYAFGGQGLSEVDLRSGESTLILDPDRSRDTGKADRPTGRGRDKPEKPGGLRE